MDEDKTLKTLSWEEIYEIWLGEMTGLNAPINPLVYRQNPAYDGTSNETINAEL